MLARAWTGFDCQEYGGIGGGPIRFLVLGYDGSDDKALERRMAVREDYLTGSQQMYAAGRWQDSGALLDEAGTMIGSFIVCDYASREEMENEWLNHEPYVIGEVWKKIEIYPVLISPSATTKVVHIASRRLE